MDPDTLCRSGSRHGLSALNRKGVKKPLLMKDLPGNFCVRISKSTAAHQHASQVHGLDLCAGWTKAEGSRESKESFFAPNRNLIYDDDDDDDDVLFWKFWKQKH